MDPQNDEPQYNADGADLPEAPEPAAAPAEPGPPAELVAQDLPEGSEATESPEPETEVASRRAPPADLDDDEFEVPQKSAIKEPVSGRPTLPPHMNEDDTPRDPETISMHWYVLKVQSNREKSIKDSLDRRIKREGMQDYFGAIVIPTEKVVETKGGKRKIREQKLFPGYMMIQVRLTDETWFLVRDTSGVGDFTGSAGRPIPMQEHEIQRMLGGPEEAGEEEKPHRPVVKFSIGVGDVVKVKEGPFESFEGNIDSLDEASGKVKVIIEIFGRPTEVELEHWQVEKA
jgi:transcription termination/antitermination protein NusG